MQRSDTRFVSGFAQVLSGALLTVCLITPYAYASGGRSSIPHSTSAATGDTIYFSSLSYSGTPDGTSAHPFTNVALVPSQLSPGKVVLLERGSSWHVPGLTWNLSNKGTANGSPMYIGAYGDPNQPRPVVASMVMDSLAEWRGEGNDVFSTPQYDSTWTSDHVYRLYIDRTPLTKVPNTTSLTEDTYCVSAGRIYLKRSSFANTPYVESIQGVADYAWIILATDTHNLTIADLEFRGGGGGAWCALLFLAPTTSITLSDLEVRQFIHYGIQFSRLVPSASQTNRNVAVLDCIVDKGWTLAMNNEYRYGVSSATRTDSLGAAGGEPGGDGIGFANCVDGAVARGCFVTNMGHTAIGTEYKDETLTDPGLRNLLIESNTVTAGTSSYCRAFGLGGPSPCGRMVVRRNYAYDLTVSSQFEGDSIYVYSNVFDTVNDSPVDRPGCASFSAGLSTGWHAFGTEYTAASNSVFANNTIVEDDAMLSSVTVDAGTHLHDLTFANNICVGWQTMQSAWSAYDCYPVSAAMVLDQTNVDRWAFLANGFWRSFGAETVLAVKQAIYGDHAFYPTSSINTWSGSSGNAWGDPSFVGGPGHSAANFALGATSPYRSSGTSLASLLPEDLAPVDFDGNTFGPTPSLGALQYPFVGLTGASIANAPAEPVKLNSLLSTSATLVPSNADISAFAWTLMRDTMVVQTGTQATFAESLKTAGIYTLSLAVTDKLGYVRNAEDATITVFVDTIPPDSVVFTSGYVGRTSIMVAWNAPGDDGSTGQADEYHLRYSTSPFTESNFETNGSPATASAPAASGTGECASIDGLISCTNFYVALKTRDHAGNWSAISRRPALKTRCTTYGEVECNSGARAQPYFDEERLPTVMELTPPYPNPITGPVSVAYGVPNSDKGKPFEVAVFDVSGRLVTTLTEGPAQPGRFHLQWSARASSGAPVRAGLYFVRFRLGDRTLTRVFTLLQ